MQEKVNLVSESFLEVLREMPADYASKFKILKNRLFIPQNELQDLLEYYKGWLIKAGVGAYTDEKLKSRIFAGADAVLFYLPEGNNVEIGHFANLPTDIQLKIPVSNSVPINASDYLHPRDVDYQNLKGVEIRRPLNKPMEIVFEIREDKLKCSESFLRKVVAKLRASNNISEKYPNLSRSLKDALLPLKNILEQAKTLSKSKTPLIPLRFQDDSAAKFFSYMHLVFIVKDSVLLDVYENKGRGFDEFINDEIIYLADKLNIKTLDTLQISTRDKYLLGRIRIAGKWFAVEKKAFRFLVESAALSRWFKGKIGKLFTIRDILNQIVPVLKNADWIDVSKLGRHPDSAGSKNSRAKFELKYSPWTFKTGKNYSIVEFVEGGGGERKSNSFKSRRR